MSILKQKCDFIQRSFALKNVIAINIKNNTFTKELHSLFQPNAPSYLWVELIANNKRSSINSKQNSGQRI